MEYELIRSERRTLSLQIKRDGKILVRAPLKASKKAIDEFVSKHENWIKSKLEIVKNRHVVEDFSENEIKELKNKLKEIITPILEKYSKIMGVEYTKVSINSAKGRFGSCSSKKTLNFSYRLVLYPYEAIEYVCVHELAHIKEMNHSRKFWQIVASILPDYKKRKELLKK
jgi:predicted metal-dependent hydrolase